MKPIQIELNRGHIETVLKFTENRNKKEDYDWYEKHRKASNAMLDSVLGKIGEMALSLMLRQYKVLVYPDFTYHKIKNKSYDADLGQNLHCKTCSLATRNFLQEHNRTDLYSWIFQHSDKLVHSPQAYEKDLVGLVYLPHDHKNKNYLEYNNLFVEIVAIIPWKNLYPLLDDPVLSYKKGYKYAIYSNHQEFQQYIKRHYWSKVARKIKPTNNSVVSS